GRRRSRPGQVEVVERVRATRHHFTSNKSGAAARAEDAPEARAPSRLPAESRHVVARGPREYTARDSNPVSVALVCCFLLREAGNSARLKKVPSCPTRVPLPRTASGHGLGRRRRLPAPPCSTTPRKEDSWARAPSCERGVHLGRRPIRWSWLGR